MTRAPYTRDDNEHSVTATNAEVLDVPGIVTRFNARPVLVSPRRPARSWVRRLGADRVVLSRDATARFGDLPGVVTVQA